MSNENIGAKVSKSGYDTKEAEEEKNLLFSPYPLLKLNDSGIGTLEKNSGETSVTDTIYHGLGYVPICYVFGKVLDGGSVTSTYKEFNDFIYSGLQVYDEHYYYADSSNLYIKHTTVNYEASDYNLPYFYYIFHDEET